jgi:hypothetical protein
MRDRSINELVQPAAQKLAAIINGKSFIDLLPWLEDSAFLAQALYRQT